MLSLTYLSEYTRTSAGTLETTQSTVKGLIFFKSDFRHLLSLLPCIKLRKPKFIGFKQDIYYSNFRHSSTKFTISRLFPRQKHCFCGFAAPRHHSFEIISLALTRSSRIEIFCGH